MQLVAGTIRLLSPVGEGVRMRRILSVLLFLVLMALAPLYAQTVTDSILISGETFYYVIEASPRNSVRFVSSLDSTEDYTTHPITNTSSSHPQFYLIWDCNVPGTYNVTISVSPLVNNVNKSIRLPYTVEIIDVDSFESIAEMTFNSSDENNMTDSFQRHVNEGESLLRQYSFLYTFDEGLETMAAGTYESTITVNSEAI